MSDRSPVLLRGSSKHVPKSLFEQQAWRDAWGHRRRRRSPGRLLCPGAPERPQGARLGAHTGRSKSPESHPVSRGSCATHASRSFLSSRCTLACTSENVNPPPSPTCMLTANLCTAHQSVSLCLACVYWGRDETPRRKSRRAHFLIIPNYKSAKWTLASL